MVQSSVYFLATPKPVGNSVESPDFLFWKDVTTLPFFPHLVLDFRCTSKENQNHFFLVGGITLLGLHGCFFLGGITTSKPLKRKTSKHKWLDWDVCEAESLLLHKIQGNFVSPRFIYLRSCSLASRELLSSPTKMEL